MHRLVMFGGLLALTGGALAHTYHLGACPVVEPMPGFEMNKVCKLFFVTIYFDHCNIGVKLAEYAL